MARIKQKQQQQQKQNEQQQNQLVCLSFGFLTSSSTTRLYHGRAPRQFYVLPHMRQSWETMTSVSAGHIILTPTQPIGSGRPLRESNPGPPHQESRALPTELPPPPPLNNISSNKKRQVYVTAQSWRTPVKLIKKLTFLFHPQLKSTDFIGRLTFSITLVSHLAFK